MLLEVMVITVVLVVTEFLSTAIILLAAAAEAEDMEAAAEAVRHPHILAQLAALAALAHQA